jgi:hypothetical protein
MKVGVGFIFLIPFLTSVSLLSAGNREAVQCCHAARGQLKSTIRTSIVYGLAALLRDGADETLSTSACHWQLYFFRMKVRTFLTRLPESHLRLSTKPT